MSGDEKATAYNLATLEVDAGWRMMQAQFEWEFRLKPLAVQVNGRPPAPERLKAAANLSL